MNLSGQLKDTHHHTNLAHVHLLRSKEKTLIAIADPKTLLNCHTELLVKCHHRHMISN